MVITQELQVFTHFNNHDFSIRQILNTNSYSKIFNKFAHLVLNNQTRTLSALPLNSHT